MIDMEALVGDYLRTHPLLNGYDLRVAGKIPKTFTRPWIIVTQLDAIDKTASTIDHLISYPVQLSCYAGSELDNAQVEASTISRLARQALAAMKYSYLGSAVVSNVSFYGHSHLPDADFEPPRECYILTAVVTAHD